MANDFVGGSSYFNDESAICNGARLAFVVRFVWRNYGGGTEIDEILLWDEETEAGGQYCYYDGCGNDDDITDYALLFWYGFANLGGGEFIHSTNFVYCNGLGIRGWCGGGITGSAGRCDVFGYKNVRLSHCRDRVFREDGAVCD